MVQLPSYFPLLPYVGYGYNVQPQLARNGSLHGSVCAIRVFVLFACAMAGIVLSCGLSQHRQVTATAKKAESTER